MRITGGVINQEFFSLSKKLGDIFTLLGEEARIPLVEKVVERYRLSAHYEAKEILTRKALKILLNAHRPDDEGEKAVVVSAAEYLTDHYNEGIDLATSEALRSDILALLPKGTYGRVNEVFKDPDVIDKLRSMYCKINRNLRD